MSSLKPLLKPDVTLSLALSPSPAHDHEILKPEERGIRLIQLLLKGAKHASSGNFHRADACLSEISELSSMSGDSMQRLAAQFASALATRLVKRWPGLYKALNHHQKPRIDVDQAKTLFARAFPFLCFAYMVITRTLVQAMANEHVIHIVDLSSGDPKLWVPFLHSLAHLPNGPPHLKITCLNSNRAILDKLGQSLVKEAETLDMPFQFNPLSIGLRELSGDMLKVRSGEALAFVSILNLHVLLAEDDQVDAHFGGAKFNGNLGGEGRMILEEMFGREIENIVACEGLERFERHERYGRWAIRLGQGGFKPIRLWYNFNEDTKQMVDGFGKGYKIASEKTSLMICWHERPLYAVTAWTC
ncbi:hypothetical protein GH714_012777 [Hevea brasiliensis]|uniref:Uncharacterized protein n=1 Tax=Hevea brasiliensis TaxID=3981 RepID=A0A6A6MMX8_HEVBR|nr:hypothetical protein GH714_012777 [Hevea brasiliensis]